MDVTNKTFRIWRHDPDSEDQNLFQEYHLGFPGSLTVLEAVLDPRP